MRPEIATLLTRFAAGLDLLDDALKGLTPEQLDLSRAPGKWSIRQIVCHVADTELVYTNRARFILSEERPPLLAFDQDLWAAAMDYAHQPVDHALALLRVLRAQSGHILRHAPDAAWERAGVHSSAGEQTLLQVVVAYTDHLEKHIGQIRETRQVHGV